MKLVEQHIIKRSDKRFKAIDLACFKSKNLYNAGLYIIKQNFIKEAKWLRYATVDKLFKESNNVDYRAISNNSSQQTLRLLDQNLKSYFASIKAWKRDNKKFLGCPKFPKYLDKRYGRFQLVYTYNQIGFKDNYITFPKMEGIPQLRTKCKKEDIKQVRFIPKNKQYVIEVVYEIEDHKPKELPGKMGVDIGLNNLATISSKDLSCQILINGKPLKSINQYYNKKLSKLKSELKKNHGRKKSNKISSLTLKRNNKVKDYMHKASKIIVDIALENDIGTIVVGKNENWKQEINIGKKNNQSFVSIPHTTLLNMIRHKSEKAGLTFIEREESYTSKISSFDLEPICKQENYLGKRVKRGLFRTSSGKLINADVNGAFNILRKEFGDAVMPTNIGLGLNPLKINI